MAIIKDKLSAGFSPTICVTHRCNLSCTYCYQKQKSNARMSVDVGKKCIDDIFANLNEDIQTIEISFIGGEPLLEMELIKALYDYTLKTYHDERVHFFATTNGTTLTEDDKRWFSERKKSFILGLSLDGTKDVHNFNRSNSFDYIDTAFFASNWPAQGPKMTISEKTLDNLADSIIFIHNLGFSEINGVNFAEGDFDWDNRVNLRKLSEQLQLLVDYYSGDYSIKLDQMFGKHIEFCSSKNSRQYKSCGIGTRTVFYDTDGKKYPCPFTTPMTFCKEDLERIEHINFDDPENFVDKECYNGCYLYPVCGTCSGANYLVNGSFSNRIKSRCNMNKLIALYIAEYHTRKLIDHREMYSDDNQVYYLIEAIKGIRSNFFDEFKDVFLNS